MVRLRAKDSRAKKINDFKKVKAKVGRHAKRGPVTVITVKAKRIVMPHQQSILNEPVSDESARITILLRQFHHHSSTSRSSALDDLAALLSESPIAAAHIALVLPTTLELLYDDDKDTRQNLLKLISNVLTKCPAPSVYESIAPVVVTYTCSGLTSLDKGVRKDTLQLLLLFLESDAALIFAPFADKILHHMLTVLVETSRLTGSLHKQHSSTPTGSSGTAAAKASQSPSPASAFLLMSLTVVKNLLALRVSSSRGSSRAVPAGSADDWNECYSVVSSWESGVSVSALAMRYPLRRESVFLASTENLAYSPDDKGSEGPTASSNRGSSDSSSSLMPSLLAHLADVWNGLTLQTDAIGSAPSILPPLQCIADTCISICTILAQQCDGHRQSSMSISIQTPYEQFLTTTIFPHFPYSSVDAAIALQGSVEEVFARKHLELLNTTLCEVALSWKRHTCPDVDRNVESGDYGQVAMTFVSEALKGMIEKMKKQALAASSSSNGVSDITQCLLRCVSLQGRRGIIGLDSVLVQLGELLRTQLHSISRMKSVDSVSIKVKAKKLKNNDKDILTSVSILLSTLQCLFEISHTDFLWSMGFSDYTSDQNTSTTSRADSLSFVAEVISQIPQELVSALSVDMFGMVTVSTEDGDVEGVPEAVDGVIHVCAELLLLLMRRVSVWGQDAPAPGVDESMEGGEWSSVVHAVNTRVESFFAVEEEVDMTDGGEGVRCVYLCSSSVVRRLWLDVWFQCPFESDTHRTASSAMMCLCRADVPYEERSYFLDVLFERRMHMTPSFFVQIVMSGVEEYLESLAEKFRGEFLGGEEADAALARFNEEYLWPDGKSYMGGFLKHAANVLVAGSSYPTSTALLRLLQPFLRDLLCCDSDEYGGNGEYHNGVRPYLRVVALSTFTTELLSFWEQGEAVIPVIATLTSFEPNLPSSNGADDLLLLAAEEVCGILCSNQKEFTSALAMTMGLREMSEGSQNNIMEPVFKLICSRWTLEEDTQSQSYTLTSFLAKMLHMMRADVLQDMRGLSSLYGMLRHFDTVSILDYSRKQEVVKFLNDVRAASDDTMISKTGKTITDLRKLLDDIEQFMNCS